MELEKDSESSDENEGTRTPQYGPVGISVNYFCHLKHLDFKLTHLKLENWIINIIKIKLRRKHGG